MNLKEKTITGSAWMVGSSVGAQFVQFFFTVILARILSPKDYGIFGISYIFVGFLQIFSSLGMGAVLIQKKELSIELISSIFWLNILTGVVLCLIYAISAPWIAIFFNESALVAIIRVISLNFIITSFSIVQNTLLKRDMKFRRIALINTIAVLISGMIGVTLAISGYGVWSLVLSTISLNILVALLCWFSTSWTPKLVFSLVKVRETIMFSLNNLGNNILNFFAKSIQNVLIGKFFTVSDFGYYSMANRISSIPAQHITLQVFEVLFPGCSRLQGDLQQLRAAFLKTVSFVAIFIFPIMLGLIFVAHELILSVIGEKWISAVPFLQILAAAILFQSLSCPVPSVLLSLGRADLLFKYSLLSIFVVSLFVSIGLIQTLKCVLLLYMLSIFLLTLFYLGLCLRLLQTSFKEFLLILIPTTISSLIMLTSLLICRIIIEALLIKLPLPIYLVAFIILGAVVYAMSLRIFFQEAFREVLCAFKIIIK